MKTLITKIAILALIVGIAGESIANTTDKKTGDKKNSVKRILPNLTDEEWDRVVSEAEIRQYSVDQSPSCDDRQSFGLLPMVSSVIADDIVTGRINVVMGCPLVFCFRVNEELPVAFISSAPDDPVLQYRGRVKIDRLVAFNSSGVPPSFLSALGMTMDEYLRLPGPAVGGLKSDVFLRLKLVPGATQPDLPPRGYPFTEVLTPELLASRKLKGKAALVVDVRSEKEFRKNSISDSINIPLNVPAGLSKTFRWDVRNRDLEKIKVPLEKLLSKGKGSQIVIVGSDPSDARPIYMLQRLIASGQRGLGWLYDGVPPKRK